MSDETDDDDQARCDEAGHRPPEDHALAALVDPASARNDGGTEMTLRDYFAGQVLVGIDRWPHVGLGAAMIKGARFAYAVADAMLVARLADVADYEADKRVASERGSPASS